MNANYQQYQSLLQRKAQSNTQHGFAPLWMPDCLFDFQKHFVDWSIRQGRAALFEDCGLGKTLQQLVWGENVVRHTNKPVLLATPLAVSAQTVAEAEKFGIEAHISRAGKPAKGITITNYERLHLFNADDYSGMICDESSILKNFNGATKAIVTELMRQMKYRLLCTATACPNDFIELGTSSEALGELGYMDMLARFFKNDRNTCDIKRSTRERWTSPMMRPQWRFKGHAEIPFWRWLASWSRAARKPGDYGFDDARFILPPKIERNHIVKARTLAAGFLFEMPAKGLAAEREEQRRTMRERCETAAELISGRTGCSLVWCNLNDEGDLLEQIIPRALQVKGSDSADFKEVAAEWFVGKKCICNHPLFRAKLAIWQEDLQATGNATMRSIASNALLNRSNIKRATQKRKRNTTENGLSATANTCESTGREQPTSATSVDGNSTPEVLKSRRRQSKRPSATDCKILMQDLNDYSKNTVLPSKNIENLPPLDAQSANVRQTLISEEPSDSTLIIVTPQEALEEYSVHLAISDSVNSKTIPNCSNEPQCICGHRDGTRRLISKAKIFGYGLNFQHCAHIVYFPTHSYEQYYQAIRRCWRFGQQNEVIIDLVTTESGHDIQVNLQRKAEQMDRMFTNLVRHMNDALKIQPSNGFHKEVELPCWL